MWLNFNHIKGNNKAYVAFKKKFFLTLRTVVENASDIKRYMYIKLTSNLHNLCSTMLLSETVSLSLHVILNK